MKTDNRNFIKALNINSEKDLQKLIINKWLELLESDKKDHQIIALKELSRFSFPSSVYYQSSISSFFKKDFEL